MEDGVVRFENNYPGSTAMRKRYWQNYQQSKFKSYRSCWARTGKTGRK